MLIGSELDATFRCRHISPDATIGWRVNGSSIGLFPNITTSSLRERDILVYTLTIPARSEYNGLGVVCLAVLMDGSHEVTPLAILKIIKGTL